MVSVIAAMATKSSLTTAQVQTVELWQEVKHGQISFAQARAGRRGRVVSKGAYYRVLSQAKNNFERSLFTVLIAVQMGVLQPTDFQKLLSAVSGIPTEVDDDRISGVISVIDALVSKLLVM